MWMKSTDIFLSLENHRTFLLAKEKNWKLIFNINNELLQNCTEKPKQQSETTINWLFNDIWCYLLLVLTKKLAFSASSCKGLRTGVWPYLLKKISSDWYTLDWVFFHLQLPFKFFLFPENTSVFFNEWM